jgi:hypothetical protein
MEWWFNHTPESLQWNGFQCSRPPSNLWKITEPFELLRAEKTWEGGNLPPYPSIESAINTPVNQLRDPFIYKEGKKFYLLYAVRGENGIAIADLVINKN